MKILTSKWVPKISGRRRNSRFDKSVFVLFLISYIAVLVLAMMSNILYHKTVEKKMLENAKRSNLAMLDQLKIDIDNKIRQINELSNNIVFNTKVNMLLKGNDVLYSYYDLKQEFMAFPKSKIIYDYYVYFANTDEILTATLKSKSKDFYQAMYNYESMSFSEWHQMILNQYHFNTYLPVQQLNAYNSQQYRVLTFIQSIPVNINEDLLGQAIILIDESKIRGIIDKMRWGTHAHIYVLDKQGNVVLSSEGAIALPQGIREQIGNSGNVFHYNEGKDKATVLYQISKDTHWKYIMIMPDKEFLADIRQTKIFVFLLLLCFGLLGSILAYIFSYRNYRPIKEIKEMFNKKEHHVDFQYRNEFEYIKCSIMESFKKQSDFDDMMAIQLPVMRSDYLTKLLKGYLGEIDIDKDTLNFMKIHLLSDDFIVIIAYIHSQSCFLEDFSEKEWALARFVLANVGSELIEKKYEKYFIELERNQVAFILNIPDHALVKKSQKQIKSLVQAFYDLLKHQCKLQVTFGISNIYTGLVQLRQCYDEASKALEHGILGDQRIVFFEEMDTPEQYYYYPIDIEVQLANMIRTGNYEDAVKTVDMLFQVNFETKQMAAETGRYFIMDLMSTLIKILNMTLAKRQKPLVAMDDFLNRIFIYDGIDRIQAEIKTIIKEICEQIQEYHSTPHDRLITNIKVYITENYGSHSLSLTSIAEEFNRTPQYISTLFKTYTGQNIKDFISKIRIEKAKELLRDDQLTLTDIAKQLGYANDMGVIRLFKKYEGVTPGVYRKQIEEEKNII